ncbi:DUF3040 domain-containing protein [Aeromicrobium terrae]|uniref:DUF3040 domain-containing protein n=1 Tax=Aeromicrobium terrae TaxID=2498846 RepID=A0A5C8NM80_9ACTN|nr:DUF3040 domain-containing protein [Aeromicrobium terrae]TXL62829.1 DUF3040 domain-containing protein [Aeromicrobium terrae]
MPLSEEEARLLHQLEQSLAAEDPDFASTLRGSKFLAHNRRVAVLAVLGFVAGMALLLGGAVSAMTWLGVLGFVVMLGSAYLFVTAWKRGIGTSEERRAESAPSKPTGSIIDRFEERFHRRQDGDGF